MIRLEKFTKEMYPDLISWIGNAEELMLFAGPKLTFPLTNEQLNESLNEKGRFAFQVVNENDNLPIGHCEIYLTNNTAALGRILIGEKSFRGKGLGKIIVKKLLKYIEENIDRKKVELNVFDFNIAAVKCYEKVGFKINPNKKSERIVNGKKWIALNMTLDLENKPNG